MIENALDRLFKESEHDNDVPKYSMEEQMIVSEGYLYKLMSDHVTN